MLKFTRRFLAMALLPVLTALVTTLIPAAPANAAIVHGGIQLNASEYALLAMINNARKAYGIPQVRIVPGTTDVARRWARAQAASRTMKHNPSFAKQVGASGSPRWTRVTENVGYGSGCNAKQLFVAYMNSPGHRANILDRKVRYVGIGSVDLPDARWGSCGILYNTMNFTDYYTTGYGNSRVPMWKLKID